MNGMTLVNEGSRVTMAALGTQVAAAMFDPRTASSNTTVHERLGAVHVFHRFRWKSVTVRLMERRVEELYLLLFDKLISDKYFVPRTTVKI